MSPPALPAISRIALAQAYPSRPVRIIVSVAAGGGADIVARLIAQWLSERLGRPFIVENRPGAGGNVATEAVVRAPADGHTLLMAITPNAVNATLYDNLNFVFLRDIEPVAGLTVDPTVMAGQSGTAGGDRSGLHRLRQGQSGQDQHGLRRHRHRAARRRRTV
jgi:tripartite-type tricarboxylate transporter receptor subunit TctC